jgi:hypothetical protein
MIKDRGKLEDIIDRQVRDTFPASDPPSRGGGTHFIGAPSGRRSVAPPFNIADASGGAARTRRGPKNVPRRS